MTEINWRPASFDEFKNAAAAGRVRFQILDEQYPWLYDNVLPRTSFSYEKKLLRLLQDDEDAYWKVFNSSVDFVLD